MNRQYLKEGNQTMIVQLVFMPLFLFTYTPDKVFFWVLLILMDSYLLTHLHVMEYGKAMQEASRSEKRTATVYSIAIVLCYGILAFRNLPLFGYLVLNDIVMDVLSVFQYLKNQSASS